MASTRPRRHVAHIGTRTALLSPTLAVPMVPPSAPAAPLRGTVRPLLYSGWMCSCCGVAARCELSRNAIFMVAHATRRPHIHDVSSAMQSTVQSPAQKRAGRRGRPRGGTSSASRSSNSGATRRAPWALPAVARQPWAGGAWVPSGHAGAGWLGARWRVMPVVLGASWQSGCAAGSPLVSAPPREGLPVLPGPLVVDGCGSPAAGCWAPRPAESACALPPEERICALSTPSGSACCACLPHGSRWTMEQSSRHDPG